MSRLAGTLTNPSRQRGGCTQCSLARLARSLCRSGFVVTVLGLAMMAACRSASREPPPAPTYVLRVFVQPDGVWREDALSGRQGPLEEVRYEAEYVHLTVLLEGGEEKDLVATLASVRVTRQGELFLDGTRVAEGVGEVTLAETVRDVSGSAKAEERAEKAGDILLGILFTLVVVGALALALAGSDGINYGNPWGPD